MIRHTTAPKVIATCATSQKNVQRALAQARSLRPSEVVIWYESPEQGTGVIISEGTTRVKAVGGLIAAAMDTWNE